MNLETILIKRVMVILVLHYINVKEIFTPQSKASNKDNYFTLMGLTTLTGKSLMCCVICKGEHVPFRRKLE